MSFRVIDETEKEVPFNDEWFRLKNTGILMSWDQGSKKRMKVKNLNLKSMEVPKKASGVIECEVDLLFQQNRNLVETFQIILEASEAHHLEIKTSAEEREGILNGDSDDFQAKILGVIFADVYGNEVISTSRDPVPVLAIHWTEPAFLSRVDDGDETEDEIFLSTPKKRKLSSSSSDFLVRKSPKIDEESIETIALIFDASKHFFVPEKGSMLTASEETPVEVWLAASDGSTPSIVKGTVLKTTIQSGPPAKLAISSRIYTSDIPQVVHHDIIINRFTEFKDLQLHLWDISDNSATMKCVKKISMSVHLYSPTSPSSHGILLTDMHVRGTKDFIVKPIQLEKFIDSLFENEGVLFTQVFPCRLEFSGAYKLVDGTSRSLTSALIHCELRKLNAVTKIEVNFDTLHSLEPMNIDEEDHVLTFDGDSPLPEILVKFCTDDSVVFVPSIDDFTFVLREEMKPTKVSKSTSSFLVLVGVNHDQSSRLDALPWTDEDGASVGWKLVLKNPIKKLTMGKYSLSLAYQERRESMQSLPARAKKVETKLLFTITPGRPARIEPSIASLKDVVNLQKQSDLIIASNLSIKLFDISGNILPFPNDFFVRCRLNSSLDAGLEGCAEDGCLYASVTSSGRHFASIRLDSMTSQEDTTVQLVIEVLTTGLKVVEDIQPFIVTINVISDRHRLDKIATLVRQSFELKSRISIYDDKKNELEERLVELKTSMKSKASSSLPNLNNVRIFSLKMEF